MQKYRVVRKLGSGTFGNVQLAEDTTNKELVAIKRLKKKYSTWEECLQLSEVKALRKLIHPNIIKLRQLIRQSNDAFFVFEYYPTDLFQLMNTRKEKGVQLSNYQIRHIVKQLAQALAYVHKQGFIHRDLKPQNILLGPQMEVKLIDFGIAREVRSQPPFTQYVATRWYRAPELLFRCSTYGTSVDVFALGCIVGEMFLARPLFLGGSQMDQIAKVTSLLGSSQKTWPQGAKQAALKGINLPQYSEIPLDSVFKNCPPQAISFIAECLRWSPTKRITAAQMLTHPYLTNPIAPPLPLKTETKTDYKRETKLNWPANKAEKTKYASQFQDLL